MKRWMWLLPLLCGALAYSNVLGNGFLLDDHHFIVDNPDVARGQLLHLFAAANVTAVTFFYRPLALAIHSVEHSIFGFRAALFHIDSVLAHLVCVYLVTRLAWKCTARPTAAGCAGLLFAIHPVHTEAVTAIANRSEVLATLFYLAALNAEFSSHERAKRAAQNALYLAALLCKESAVTLPLALAALVYLRRDRDRGHFVVAALALVPALALYVGLRWHALGGWAGDTRVLYFRHEHGSERVFTIFKFFAVYLRVLIYPTVLLPDYSRYTVEHAHTLEGAVLVGMAFVMGVVGAVLILAQRKPAAAWGLALFAIGLVPYSHVIPMSGALAERFLYLPSAGLSIAVGVAVDHAATRLRPSLVFGALAVVALWLTARTLDRNLDWRSDVALWTAAVQSAPRNGAAHCLLGEVWHAQGELDRATAELEQGLALYPTSKPLYLELAGYYHEAGRHDDERRILHAAVDTGHADDQIVAALRAASWVGHDHVGAHAVTP